MNLMPASRTHLKNRIADLGIYLNYIEGFQHFVPPLPWVGLLTEKFACIKISTPYSFEAKSTVRK